MCMFIHKCLSIIIQFLLPGTHCNSPGQACRVECAFSSCPCRHLFLSFPPFFSPPKEPRLPKKPQKPEETGLAIFFGYMGMENLGTITELLKYFSCEKFFFKVGRNTWCHIIFPAGIFLLREKQTNMGGVDVPEHLSAGLLWFLH